MEQIGTVNGAGAGQEIPTISALWVRLLKECNPSIQTSRWRKNVAEAIQTTETEYTDLVDELRHLRDVVPDAYRIDVENKAVMAYEIEDSHPLTDRKLMDYLRIYSALDYYNWTFGLVRVSSSGVMSEVDFEGSTLLCGVLHNNKHLVRKWTTEERRMNTLRRPARIPPKRVPTVTEGEG